MDYSIPHLLTSIPAPPIDEKYFDEKGRLLLSLEEAARLRSEYFHHVAMYLRGNNVSMNEEIIPAVDCALRLFNAENFTGELSPAEREHFDEVYKRFGAPPAATSTKKKQNNKTTLQPTTGAAAAGESTAEAEEADAASEATKPPSAATETASGGAGVDEELTAELGKPIFASAKDAYMQRMLASDGEMANPCVRLGGLLLCVLAVVTTRDTEDTEQGSFLFPYTNPWRLRAHMRHQICLLHRAHSVFLEISSCIDAVMTQADEDISVQALLEVGQAQNYYHHRELAAETFRRAMAKSGLTVEESALVGVRTRWQEHQVVQMVLNAQSTRAVPEASTREEQPVTVMAEKDGHDLLDRPREKPDAEALPLTPLHPEDKAILLALCMDIRNNNPYHGLTQHHMQTYVERLLADPAPSPFLIRAQTLLIRARLETHRNRVQERAFLQMTELVDQYSSRRDPSQTRYDRTKSDYFYCVAYPPVWELKTEYADACFEETLYKTALDAYEQVLNWEKIIECCKKLDRRRRAESLARDLLERDPQNPMLWVALGEATREDAHLWRAWELCNHTMAAPMRALARLALDREHYEKVVEYFDNAVKINPIFGGDWFTLGYASLKLQNWNRGGEAFTRVCQIDPNDAFAWNNLASIMLRDGKLRPAFNAMSQALRNNRRDWRMWQNYFQIGCQLKEVTETTNALHIALTIAKRGIHMDRETMDMFVDNTIAYIKGEIPGSSAEAEESAEVLRGKDGVAYKSMTSAAHAKAPAGATAAGSEGANEEEVQQPVVSAEPIEHLPVSADSATLGARRDEEGEETDAEAEGLGDLVPLGADEDLTREEIYAESGALGRPRAVASASTAAAQIAIRRRHGERVRKLFQEILDTFVSDPDLYSVAARFFGFMDGPLAAYTYRLKELRACRQKDQWERSTELFTRTVECLEHMTKDVTDAFAVAQEAAEAPPAATAPSVTPGEAAAESAAPTPAVPNGDSVISALKDTQNNVKAVLEATEEHMEGTERYEALQTLAKRVRSTLQEAKATFV